MKESNQLENLLHSWTLRRPSARLREKLFANEVLPEARPGSRISWNWLVPATLCAFTLLVMVNGHSYSETHFDEPATNLFFASVTMTSMPSMNFEPARVFALSKQDLNLEQNVWYEAIFESTNLARNPSSKRSLPAGKTNSLTL